MQIMYVSFSASHINKQKDNVNDESVSYVEHPVPPKKRYILYTLSHFY